MRGNFLIRRPHVTGRRVGPQTEPRSSTGITATPPWRLPSMRMVWDPGRVSDREPQKTTTPVKSPTPFDRALATRRTHQESFAVATRAGTGSRLRRSDLATILELAYGMVRDWQAEGLAHQMEAALRALADVPISRDSSLALVLFRSALPRLDPKRASKWAAVLEVAEDTGTSRKRFGRFMSKHGGVEGSARKRARARRRELDRESAGRTACLERPRRS
jgi:hypothetical protein